jgi:hypothetical protein
MRCTILVTAAVLTTSVAHAQGTFEGIVTYQNTATSGPKAFDYYAKGGKVRLQPHDTSASAGMGGGMMMIIDSDTRMRTIIMSARKMYVTTPLDDNVAQRMDSSMRNAKFTKAGSEIVAGVPCDDYTVTDPNADKGGTVCVAHGMGNFAVIGMGSPFGRLEQEVQGLSAAAAGGFFPLKWTGAHDSWVATKIDRKTLDASLFAAPPGYTQMQMPAGMSGMQKP